MNVLVAAKTAPTQSTVAPTAFNTANPFSEGGGGANTGAAPGGRAMFPVAAPRPTMNQIKAAPIGFQAVAPDPWTPVNAPSAPAPSAHQPWLRTAASDQPNPFFS